VIIFTTNSKNYDTIINLIPKDSKVLDLGCGDGTLLWRLINEKQIRGQGVEISYEKFRSCIARGLTVFQGNLDEGLEGFSKNSFDYVLLNYTLKFLKRPKFVIEEMLKIGSKVVIGMQNSAYLLNRVRYLFFGKMNSRFENLLVTPKPISNLISINQFLKFCGINNLKVVRKCYLNGKVKIPAYLLPNLMAESAVFILSYKF
jgi:methionine biosynthesis protein MetW